jgi:hypothetical protein
VIGVVVILAVGSSYVTPALKAEAMLILGAGNRELAEWREILHPP